MNKILSILMILFLTGISLYADQIQQDCTKNAMETGKAERDACNSKPKDEKEACKKAATDKLSAEKTKCFDEAKKREARK